MPEGSPIHPEQRAKTADIPNSGVIKRVQMVFDPAQPVPADDYPTQLQATFQQAGLSVFLAGTEGLDGDTTVVCANSHPRGLAMTRDYAGQHYGQYNRHLVIFMQGKEDIIDALRSLFNDHGLQFRRAQTPQQALEHIRAHNSVVAEALYP